MQRAALIASLIAVAACHGPTKNGPDGGPSTDTDAAVDATVDMADDATEVPTDAAPDRGVPDLDSPDLASPDSEVPDLRSDADSGCADCPPMFVGSWGGPGTDPGQFIEPSSVELHSDGVVIVAGHEDRIQRFGPDGDLIDIIGEPGAGDGQFNHPHGLAVDRQRGDLIYVGDQENGRVQVFDSDGQFVRQWGDTLFQHIHDVGIDRATGELFVPDLELHVVRKFTPEGDLIATWGAQGDGPGEFDGPWGLSTDSDGFVYVGDTYNRRVQKLDRDGNFVAEWTGYDGVTFEKPTGVYVDADDTVYVCDSLAEVIVLFDAAGTVVETWDIAEIYGQRSEPEDVVVSDGGDEIYVAEVFGHRVLHLQRR